jgi:hypothetical protein
MSSPITTPTMGPCSWILDPTVCDPDWAGYSDALKTAAIDFATLILWSATGRQFSQCPVTVRPCLNQNNEWGFRWWADGVWYPYIWNGQWFNGFGCGCWGGCGLHPFTQAWLPGPIAGIVNVTIDGVTVDPTAYRVDDAMWLVRQDGNQWPILPNFNLMPGMTGTWSVDYIKGWPPPPALLNAAAILASQYARACTGGACRLPGYVTQVIRTGVSINMINPSDLLKNGFTGLIEVDQVIRALNPNGLTRRLRVWSPDVERNRIQTTP